jgi:hypothetical protein
VSHPGSGRPALVTTTIAALAADATLLSLLGGTARVYVNVPDNTPAPYLWVLGGTEVPMPETMAALRRRIVGVSVAAVSAHRGTAEVDALLSRVIEVLTPEAGAGPAVTGYSAQWWFRSNDEPERIDNDGTDLWMGLCRFEVWLS